MPTVEQIEVSYRGQIAAAAQADANALDKVADGLDRVGESIEVTDNRITRTTKTAEGWVKTLDTVTKSATALQKAQDRLNEVTETVNEGVRKGEVTQAEAARTIDAQTAKVKKLSDAHDAAVKSAKGASDALQDTTDKVKLSGYQFGIVADEAHKFFDQVMSGGSAMKAAFYQVPNMVQVMGGFGSATKIVTGFLAGPGGLAVAAAGAGAAIYEMASSAEEEQSRLAKLSTQLKATREDALHMAGAITSASESLKGMPGWDEASARSAATAIGSTYNFTGSSTDISTLSGIARDAGSIFGSLEDGLKAVQTAMVDPTAEIEALYKQHLPGVDAALVEQVKNLQASGEQGEAYALVIGKIRDASKDAYDQGLTPFQRSLEDLEKTASPVTKAISDLVTGMGARLLEWLTDLIKLIPTTGKVSTDGLAGSTVLDNYAGGNHHYGLGQVDPRYASGYDISTPQGNIDAAIKIFQQANARAGGNWDNTLAYYSGNKVGSLGQKSYNSAVYGYDINTLPSDTSSLIDTEASRLGLSSRLINLFKGVIGHESGGHQYVDHTGSTSGSAAAIQHATSAGVIDNTRSLTGGAADAASGYSASSWSEQRAGIEAYIASQQKLLAAQDIGSQKWKETQESITSARIALANTLSPQEKITQGLTDSLEPLKSQTGYWRSMAEVVAQFDQTTRGTGTDQQALTAAMAAKQQQLASAYDDGTVSAERQARSQQAIADAAGGSAVALQHATNYQQAYTEALNDFDEGSPKFLAAVQKRTAALDESAAAQLKAQQVQQNAGLSDNLEMIAAQTASIGQNAQARQVNLAVMQAELEKHREYGEVLPPEAQDYIDLTGKMAEATAEYQHQQDALSELTSDISSMADTLSNDFTQAFVNAANGGVTFKSAMQGIESQIVSMIAKLTLINPLLNAIDGQSRNTLGDVTSALSGVGRTSSAGSSIYTAQDDADAMGGLGSYASTASSAASLGSHTSAFGNFFSGKAPDGSGIFSSLGSTLGTVGMGLGIAGTAFSVGKMIASLFGGHKKNPYTIDQVQTIDGQLSLGQTWNQAQTDSITEQLKTDISSINSVLSSTGADIGGGYLGTVRNDKNNKNAAMRSVSLTDLLKSSTLTSSDATFNQALSQGMPTDITDVSTYTAAIQSLKTMADTVDQLGVSVSKFNSDGTVTIQNFTEATGDLKTALDTALDGKSLSTSDLQTQISTISTFVNTTMPSLLSATVSGQQSWVDQMATLKQTYDAAASQASAYGLDGSSITSKYQSLYDQGYANNMTTLNQSDAGVRARYLTATGDDQGAALLNFDTSADQQRQSLKDTWRSFLGDAYSSQQAYVDQSADLEKTLAAERLQIQQQYNGTSVAQLKQYQDQAQQSVTSVFSSLTDYARGLNTSDASPLSAQAQYQSANDNLMSDYQAAMGGDYDALSRIQSDAGTFLSTSKTWQGSGTGYSTDFTQVSNILKALGQSDSDKITANLVQKLANQQTDATKAVSDQMAALLKVVEGMQKQFQLQAVTDATRPRAA